MIRVFFLLALLSSCASNIVKVGHVGNPHASMLDKSHVSSGIPDITISSITDTRPNEEKLGEVKVGAFGNPGLVEFAHDFNTDLSTLFNSFFLRKGFMVSEESKNQLSFEIYSLKLWESPPRHIPERSFCAMKAKVKLFSARENRDVWLGDITVEVESPEGFDVTGMLNATFQTCVDYFVSNVARDNKLQKILNYTFQ